MSGRDRQLNAKDDPSRRLVFGVHSTMMPFDDRPHDREPHPQPGLLRREEGLECMQLRLGREPGSGVADEDFRLVSTRRASAHHDLASARLCSHGVNGVERQIEDDLLQLHGITDDRRKIGREREPQIDAMLHGLGHQEL